MKHMAGPRIPTRSGISGGVGTEISALGIQKCKLPPHKIP